MAKSGRKLDYAAALVLYAAKASVLIVAFGLALPVLSAKGQTFTTLYAFSGTDGANPLAGLMRDAAGNLYGTTFAGGNSACNPSGCGLVFKLDTSGTETILYSFAGYPKDGANPAGGLISDASGNLYGTTQNGGVSNYGTVFKIDTSGKATVMHSFKGGDGKYPYGTLVLDDLNDLYGTTSSGGSANRGIIFKADSAGKETVLHTFRGYPRDGSRPMAGLIRDSAGNFYGTTAGGGYSQYGTVFKLDSGGKYTVLHNFDGADGANPKAGLIRDSKGTLYGTTQAGGKGACTSTGCGVVFKLDVSGRETVVFRFGGTPDGEFPVAALFRDSQGNLYSTTEYGGHNDCEASLYCGTIFRIDKRGVENLSFSFGGNTCETGYFPAASLIRDAAGNFYGTATQGGCSGNCGSYGCGTVFKYTP